LNTLSMLLPVYNAHHNLERSAGEILELLGEMSDHFELCILDDGSTDDTAEAAGELAASYPQVRVIRHPVRLGLAEALQTGLDNTLCETILFGHDDYSLDPYDLMTLWRLREVERRMAAHTRSLPTIYEEWLAKLQAWRPGRGPRVVDYQLIRRTTFEQFRLEQAAQISLRVDRLADRSAKSSAAEVLRPNFLGKVKRFAWQE
jgi:glycosyltransferase involved in cell wall biosynthesis